MIYAFGATILLLCVMFITNDGFVYWMNFKTPPHPEYTVVILVLGLAGGLFSFCREVTREKKQFKSWKNIYQIRSGLKYLIRGWIYQWVWPRLSRLRPVRHTYQKIEKELKSKPDWPKLGGKDISKGMACIIYRILIQGNPDKLRTQFALRSRTRGITSRTSQPERKRGERFRVRRRSNPFIKSRTQQPLRFSW